MVVKKLYETPRAEKLEFDYTNTVVASKGKNPAQCTGHNPGHGCGKPHQVTEGNSPGNCSKDQPRKNQHFHCW